MTVTLEEISKLQKSTLLLNDVEKKKFREIVREARNNSSSKDTEKTILKALAFYSGVASRWLLNRALVVTVNTIQIISASDLMWIIFYPYWKKMVEPLMKAEILRRQLVATKRAIPDSVLAKMAENFSKRLGQYYTTTSAEAMATGFNAYVNRRVPARLAAEKVYSAFGLTKRQMTAYVSANFETKITSSRRLDPKARAKRFIAGKLNERLKRMADDESYHMSQEAEQIINLHRVKIGEIPITAQRIWVTAEDEFVCPICAPMDGEVVGIVDHFELADGTKEWVAGVHPNCRCHIEIIVDEKTDKVQKAMALPILAGNELHQFNQAHPRNGEGQFSSKPKKKLKFKPKDIDPILQQLQDQINSQPAPEQEIKSQGSEIKPQGISSAFNISSQGGIKSQITSQGQIKSQQNSVASRNEIKSQRTAPVTAKDRAEMTDQQKKKITIHNIVSAKKLNQAKVDLKTQIKQDVSTVAIKLQSMESNKIILPSPPSDTVKYFDTPMYSVVADDSMNYGVRGGDEYGAIGVRIDSSSVFVTKDEVQDVIAGNLDTKINDAVREFEGRTVPVDVDGETVNAEVPIWDLPSVIRAVATNDERTLEIGDVEMSYGLPESGGYAFDDELPTVTMSYQDVADALDIRPEQFVVKVFRTDEAYLDSGVTSTMNQSIEEWNIDGVYEAREAGVAGGDNGVQMEVIQLNVPRDDKGNIAR